MAAADTKEQEGTLSDEQLQAQVARNQKRRAGAEDSADNGEARDTKAVLKAASENKQVTDEEVKGALDFFLATEGDEEVAPSVEPKTLKLNLGTKDKARYVRWVITPVEDTEITRLRRTSQVGTRAQRRRGDGEVDEALVARKIVTRGTVDPDVRELAREMGTGPDPGDAIHAFFARAGKTGLITQISGEILSISGWDDEDVQEVEAARG